MKKSVLAVLICAAAICCAQSPAPRPINFTQHLIAFDGKPLSVVVDKDKPAVMLTLGDVCVNALETPIDEDRSLPGTEKFSRDQLARKIFGGKSVVLTAEEIALLKDRIGKVYGAAVVGAAWPLLDPASANAGK